MNQQHAITIVDYIGHFNESYRAIVEKIVQNRKQSELTQASMAEWLEISRTTLIDFEAGKKIDFELLLKYGFYMGIDVKLTIEEN